MKDGREDTSGLGRPPVLLLITNSEAVRQPVREAARRDGYTLAEATTPAEADRWADPGVDVIVLDLGLRGAAAETLVGRLQERFGAEVPIIGLTGFFSAVPGHATTPTPIAAYLPRPVDPDQLCAALAEHAQQHAAEHAEDRGGHHTVGDAPSSATLSTTLAPRLRVLLADDDPIQLKLSQIRLGLEGYTVLAARDGREALALARHHRPDAIVSDILMPGLTGFELCVEVRNTAALANVPVVLVSSAFVEAADRRLASECGATDFVVRTPSLAEVLQVLSRALSGREPLVAVPERGRVEPQHIARLRRQLEMQVALNRELARRNAFHDAELTVLNRIADALSDGRDIQATLNEVLHLCVERGALSIALLYLYDRDGLPQIKAMTGHILDGAHEVPDADQITTWTRPLLERGHPVVVPGPELGASTSQAILATLRVSSALITGLRLYGRPLGWLVLGAEQRDLSGEVWATYARTIAMHIAQALTLHRALTSRAESVTTPAPERRARLTLELRGLSAFAAAIREVEATECAEVLDVLAALFAAPVATFDLRACLGALGESMTASGTPLLVDGNAPALTFALDRLRSWYVGDGQVTRLLTIEVDEGWALHLTVAGGTCGPTLCGIVGREIIRRHGGDVVERSHTGDTRALVIRLPRAGDRSRASPAYAP